MITTPAKACRGVGRVLQNKEVSLLIRGCALCEGKLCKTTINAKGHVMALKDKVNAPFETASLTDPPRNNP